MYTLTRLMQDAGYSYMSFYLTDYLKLPTVSYRDDNVTGLHCCAVVFWARCLIVLSGNRSRTHLSGQSKANKVSDVSPIMWCCYLLWSSDCNRGRSIFITCCTTAWWCSGVQQNLLVKEILGLIIDIVTPLAVLSFMFYWSSGNFTSLTLLMNRHYYCCTFVWVTRTDKHA